VEEGATMLDKLNTKITNVIYDGDKLQHKYFNDLVKNEIFFHKLISDSNTKFKNEINDDSNLPLGIPSIDDIKHDMINNPSNYVGREIVVTCQYHISILQIKNWEKKRGQTGCMIYQKINLNL